MTRLDLKNARLKRGWTQEEVADKLGVTQAYLSMVEQGHRPLSSQLLARVQKSFHLGPTMLPLKLESSQLENSEKLKSELGALGYKGFGYLRGKPTWNPAQVLFTAVNQPNLEPRVAILGRVGYDRLRAASGSQRRRQEARHLARLPPLARYADEVQPGRRKNNPGNPPPRKFPDHARRVHAG